MAIALGVAEDVAGVGADDEACFGDGDGLQPDEPVEVAEQMEAIDGVLGVFGGADEVVAQAAARLGAVGVGSHGDLRRLKGLRRQNGLSFSHGRGFLSIGWVGIPRKSG